MSDEEARETAAKALSGISYRGRDTGHGLARIFVDRMIGLGWTPPGTALSPVPDEELDEIERRASGHEKRYPWRYQEGAKDFLAIDRKRLITEVRRLRAVVARLDTELSAAVPQQVADHDGAYETDGRQFDRLMPSDREALARIICSAVYGEPDNLSRATEAADAFPASVGSDMGSDVWGAEAGDSSYADSTPF